MDRYDVFTETKTKVRLTEGFTPEQRAEFDKGISVEYALNEIGRKYGFL